ncbi:T9SS type A sorting domain-containing protein [Chryseobacterium pennipullorum]|uniref:VWFA domain-containing protein n=1 Tax=Chryseobacterium pennipullorum TaxID=2258963 RepID=A0A3D9B390_9FLAO|nr:T9SS type A sorting domain-containing protein [Chryseobacterium pennipullorum]REC47706.1 hypothetical protein DRF67_09580 [Chryseobacterium pennipullorum]
MRKSYLFFLFALFAVCNPLKAQTDYIICMDNGSTISDARFKGMQLTAARLIERLMACNSKNRYAVVHYGAGPVNGPSLGLTPRIYIESDFTNSTFPEPFLTRKLKYGQHLHEALGLIGNALDNIYNPEIVSPQTSLHKNGASKFVVVVLTDGSRNTGDLSNGSYLVNYYDTGLNDPGAFKNVTDFKINRAAKLAMIHISPNSQSTSAGAAMTSVGGSYTGAVESNTDDPDYGILPRLYYSKANSFIFDSVSEMPKFDELANNICSGPMPYGGTLKFFYEFTCGMLSDYNVTGQFSIPSGSVVLGSKLVLRDLSTGMDYGISTTPAIVGNELKYHFYSSDINIPPGSTGKYIFIMTLQHTVPNGGSVETISFNHYPFFPYDLDLSGSCSRTAPGSETGSFKISPNPVRGAFKIVLDKPMTAGTVQIIDIAGTEVYRTSFINQKEINADLTAQREGIYVVKITSDKNEVYSQKLIKN